MFFCWFWLKGGERAKIQTNKFCRWLSIGDGKVTGFSEYTIVQSCDGDLIKAAKAQDSCFAVCRT